MTLKEIISRPSIPTNKRLWASIRYAYFKEILAKESQQKTPKKTVRFTIPEVTHPSALQIEKKQNKKAAQYKKRLEQKPSITTADTILKPPKQERDGLFLRSVHSQSVTLPAQLRARFGTTFTASVLIDSGAMASFINKSLVHKHGFKTEKLAKEIIVRNADNTENIAGRVTHCTYLALGLDGYPNHREIIRLYVSNIGTDDVILGHTWL